MAKVKSITASYGKTINLGNYNNMRLEAEIEVELEEGDNAEEVFKGAFGRVYKEVELRAKALGGNKDE